MSDLIQVALPLPVDRTFTYRIPSGFETCSRPGCRAVVPFGRRVLTGLIVHDPEPPAAAGPVREVLDLPDAEPLLREDLLELTRWISRYYFCSWGLALKAALPGGQLQAGLRTARLAVDHLPGDLLLDETGRWLLEVLRSQGASSVAALSRKYRISETLSRLRALEDRRVIQVQEILPRASLPPVRREMVSPAEGWGPEELRRHAEEAVARAPRQAGLLRELADHPGPWATADLLVRTGASRSSLKALLAEGCLRSWSVEVKRYPTLEALSARDEAPLPTPNADQARALAALGESLEAGEIRTYLLYGVTGSGKTLVYQKAIERALELGGTALVLIPEISLTPQMVGRFRAMFGDRIALQHSAMSAGERTDVWRGIRAGEFPLVVGARSAVFAPLRDLKLIVVDEEGDTSFKQNEPDPRYHARDTALVRARLCGAVAVLGSATPSMESFHNAARGRYTLLELPVRVDGIPPPAIRFIRPPVSRQRVLGPELERALGDRILKGEQVILLRNRRGFHTYVFCPACGHLCRCRHCELALTFHRAGQIRPDLRCHLCGYRAEAPLECPVCGGPLRYTGSGTQRVEDDLARILLPEKVVRLDLDTTSRKGAHHRLLQGFARGNYTIMLGTKMVARGHDYPGVTLVGVISADAELAFPDFRCDERAFVLLLQAAGRAGRAAANGAPGEVIIQTWLPDHPVLSLVRQGDYRAFYDREIALRRSAQYPPHGWLVLFGFSARTEAQAFSCSGDFAREAAVRLPQAEWLGPTPAPRPRLRDRHRYQVVAKVPRSARAERSPLHRELRALIQSCRQKLPVGVHFTVDVDPIQLL